MAAGSVSNTRRELIVPRPATERLPAPVSATKMFVGLSTSSYLHAVRHFGVFFPERACLSSKASSKAFHNLCFASRSQVVAENVRKSDKPAGRPVGGRTRDLFFLAVVSSENDVVYPLPLQLTDYGWPFRIFDVKESGLPKLSLAGQKTTVEVTSSYLYYVNPSRKGRHPEKDRHLKKAETRTESWLIKGAQARGLIERLAANSEGPDRFMNFLGVEPGLQGARSVVSARRTRASRAAWQVVAISEREASYNCCRLPQPTRLANAARKILKPLRAERYSMTLCLEKEKISCFIFFSRLKNLRHDDSQN
ncbi:hypothetical protein EVAR_41749_1 [Eumeta japonica]|uniref:Uncharacterized protein n=1 Tax=Eumeta variegata TaxID=151549 RepID=A0A4C1VYL6_EUMVA|nr:hypothetical protein EVAR_41749_1 [Eumeta japonica]